MRLLKSAMVIWVALAGAALAQYRPTPGGDARWKIVRAQYGAGNSWRDVTQRVQEKVSGDNLSFRVNNDALGGDPAPNQKKILRIDAQGWRGESQSFTFHEGDTVTLKILTAGSVAGPGSWGDRDRDRDRWGPLQITRATYGVGDRVRDVTDALNAQVRNNQLNLRVSNQTMGGDPAEGHAKTLTVWYTTGGRPGQVTLREGQMLTLGGGGFVPHGGSGGLRLLRAEYGVGDRWVDVTQRLNSQISNDKLSVRVTNETMGRDPAEEKVKTLVAWYVYDGRTARVIVNEKDTLNLPARHPYYSPGLQIMRAQYGADYRFRDVTDLLNSQVQGDRLRIRVTNETMGGDPAEERPKTLIVSYIYNGEQGRTTVNEKDYLDLPGATSWWPGIRGEGGSLQILRAIYGSGERNADVTGRVAAQLRGDELNMQVTNESMGGDPAEGQPKRLRVIYLWQGLRYETNVPEKGRLDLP
ncbi:MAG TPA: hypothetical protein VFA68_17390 [Terriglobales bacterium]|nr:hypothetical protein [Terriglobales bacterium]